MGDARRTNMSTLPQSSIRCYYQSFLHYYASVVRPFDIIDARLEVSHVHIRTWPQPVLLKQIEEGPLPVRVWNPKVRLDGRSLVVLLKKIFQLYPGDRAHRMPIITPAYPSMCATHNVTASTQMIMTEEFKRGDFLKTHRIHWQLNFLHPGSDIVDKVIVGTGSWSELFTKHDFFHKYRYYLQVIASTGDPDLQIKWWVLFLSLILI